MNVLDALGKQRRRAELAEAERDALKEPFDRIAIAYAKKCKEAETLRALLAEAVDLRRKLWISDDEPLKRWMAALREVE